MVQNTLSSSAPGAWVNHTVEFSTNNTVPAGGKIDFKTESGFFYIPTTFSYSDMDLLVRSPGAEEYESRALGSMVSGTTSAVSVGAGSFGSIVITLAEELPAASRIKIRLGTHAEYGGQGENNIRNPAVSRSYVYFLETRDQSNNKIDNAKGMVAIIEPVTMEHAFDVGIPIRSNGLPDGELPGNTEKATISLSTDVFSICKFSTEPGVGYPAMPYSFSSSYRTLHSYVIDYLENETEYSFYVRCANVMGEYNFDDYEISFSVAPAPSDVAVPGDPDDEPDDPGGVPGPPGSGGGRGGGTGAGSGPGDGEEYPPHTGTVILEGWSYPNSRLFVLKDGVIVSEDRITDARFYKTISEVEYGGYTFSVYADDPAGVRSSSLHSTITVRSDTTNRISDLFLPPTVSPKGGSISPGGTIDFSGYAYPDSEVRYEVLRSRTAIRSGSARSLSDGSWETSFNTEGLDIGTYTFRVRAEIDGINQNSDWENVVFGVGVEPEDSYLSADLNRDGRVNLADFSILLFHWGTTNPIADINRDGRVGLPDFSIMLFQWTG